MSENNRPKGEPQKIAKDRDIDLLKIEIYADKCHTFFTSGLSWIFVFFSLIGVFYGFYYQGLITSNNLAFNVGLAGIVMIGIATLIAFYFVRRAYSENIREISFKIEAVKEGKELTETLEELVKKKSSAR